MKDIRNFFGSTAASKPKVDGVTAAQPKVDGNTKSANMKRSEPKEDFIVETDDEEEISNKPERKRLKSTKVKATPEKAPFAAGEVSSPSTAMVVDLLEEEVVVVSKSSVKSPVKSPLIKSPVKSPAPKAKEEVVLPSVRSALQSVTAAGDTTKKRKEVDAGSFFGVAEESVAAPSPKKALNIKASPVKQSISVSSPASAVPVEKKKKLEPVGGSPVKRAKTVDSAASLKLLPMEEKKFVVTGVMLTASREGIEELILSAGGKVLKSVSGKTDYLVAGAQLEDGREVCEGNKHKTALEKKVAIISEQELLDMLEKHNAAASQKADAAAQVSQSLARNATVGFAPTSSSSSSFSQLPFKSSGNTSSGSFSSSSSGELNGGMLWVDKHKPQNSSELIGSAELVKKMSDWLRRWDAVHLQKTLKIPSSKENPGARAVLLSGPPGIGKTTVATLIAREFGYDVLELNASDTRNKKQIGDQLTDAVQSRAINSSGATSLKKRLVIMDEVDGMGGSDRGGVAELIKIIKTTKTPIVCICNDRQSTKIRSLANHCFDLKVKRPTKQQIATRLVAIALKEGMAMDQNAGEILIEQVGNDIRQALNTMQMWRASSTHMSYAEVKGGMHRIEKDKVLRQTPFDACMQLLGGSKCGSVDDRYNSFFIDYSLVPLLVQQNYVDSAKNGVFKNPALDEAARMDALASAADAVSDVDLAGAGIMGQDQHWELLPAQAAFSVRVGSIIQGFQAFPAFPAWLGKNSTKGKMSRLTKEIVHHSSLSIGQGFGPIRLDYVAYLRAALLHIMHKTAAGYEGGIQEVIALLDSYGLSREDFIETLKEMQFVIEGDRAFRDLYEGLDAKIKTALTKAYNSGDHRSQVLVSEIASKGTKRSRSAGTSSREPVYDEDGVLVEDSLEAIAEEDEDAGGGDNEEDDIAAFVAKSKKSNAIAKSAKAAAKKLAKSDATVTKGKKK